MNYEYICTFKLKYIRQKLKELKPHLKLLNNNNYRGATEKTQLIRHYLNVVYSPAATSDQIKGAVELK